MLGLCNFKRLSAQKRGICAGLRSAIPAKNSRFVQVLALDGHLLGTLFSALFLYISLELAKLHILTGADFIRQLKLIVSSGEFHPVEGEKDIFSVGGENGEDYDNLMNAARKAVEHGYRVFLLPNPKGIRTADFIFERKGIYKMFDLKTITGKSSVSTRLMESIGQTNHVVLNMATDYDPRLLAKDIQAYFERNRDAREVLILKGFKVLVSITSFR